MAIERRPRVVIIGAGFGGLEAARSLSHAAVDITLIDRRNFHLFQPLLYQVATAALSPGDIAWPTRSIFRSHQNVTVLMCEVRGVDVRARTVTDGTVVIPYDFLILATGATHSYFGHDEWSAFAPALKTIDNALTIRARLLLAFEQAELSTDPVERARLMTTVIVGGGATGVEMAGAIAELDHRTLLGEFRQFEPAHARIILIEAGPRVLPSFPEHLSAIARASLTSMRVEVRTGVSVTDCNAQGVTLAGGEKVAAATIIWAAGVAASPAGEWIGAVRDRAGRVQVNPDLSVPDHPEIFVIGDTAAVRDASGRPMPGVAPAAKQMGRHVGKTIAARIRGRTTPAAFEYQNWGDLAAIGRKSAVVSLGRFRLTGLMGWLFWGAAHIWFLIGFRSRVVVAFSWLWSYLTFQRGARLISDREQSMRLLVIAACFALLSVSGCTSTRTAATSAPTAGAQVSAPSKSAPQSIRPVPAAPAQPAVSSVAGAGTTSSSGAVEAAAAPQSTSSAASATAAKSKSPTEHPAKQAGEAAPPRPPAAAAASDRSPTPPTLNLADLEQRLRDTHAIGVFTKLSLKNQVDDLLNEFRALYKGADKHPTAELRQQYDLLLLKVLSLLQDGDPSLAAAISSSREAIWGILSDPDKFAKI